jgi:FdhD protein
MSDACGPAGPVRHDGAGGETSARRGPTTPLQVVALRPGRTVRLPDRVITEEPLQIRVQAPRSEPVDVAVTCAPPATTGSWPVGYLLGEGLIEAGDVTAVVGCERPATGPASGNVRHGRPRRPAARPVAARAGVVATSCGTCGTSSVDDVVVRCPLGGPRAARARSVVLGVPEQVRAAQPLFDRTGGVHAAAEVAFDGRVVAVREDVGRHNAVDKVVGRAALAGSLPLAGRVLALSGRVAFELVQKAAIAGFPVVVAVGAPTSLAVDAASRLGVTLVGFVRDGRANVYSHPSASTTTPDRSARRTPLRRRS